VLAGIILLGRINLYEAKLFLGLKAPLSKEFVSRVIACSDPNKIKARSIDSSEQIHFFWPLECSNDMRVLLAA